MSVDSDSALGGACSHRRGILNTTSSSSQAAVGGVVTRSRRQGCPGDAHGRRVSRDDAPTAPSPSLYARSAYGQVAGLAHPHISLGPGSPPAPRRGPPSVGDETSSTTSSPYPGPTARLTRRPSSQRVCRSTAARAHTSPHAVRRRAARIAAFGGQKQTALAEHQSAYPDANPP